MTNEKTQIESKLLLALKKCAKAKLVRNNAREAVEEAEEEAEETEKTAEAADYFLGQAQEVYGDAHKALDTEEAATMSVLRDCIDAIIKDLKND